MKKFTLHILFILFGIIGCKNTGQTARQSPQKAKTATPDLLSYQKTISPEYLKKQLSILAADSMRGRETGMPGQKKAAAYLAAQYHQLGMKPVGDKNTFFQTFDLTATQTDSVVFMVSKFSKSKRDSVSQRFVNRAHASSDFIRQFGGTQKSQGEVVFAGFGIQDSSLGINQFKGLNVKGKWVMVFSPLSKHFPQVFQGDTLYTNKRSYFRSWFQNIAQKGVAGILVIPDMSAQKFTSTAEGNRRQFGQPSGMQLTYRSKERRTTPFSYDLINPATATEWLGLSGTMDSLKNEMAQNVKTFTPESTPYTFTQTPYSHQIALQSENIAAFLKGGDPKLNDQVVVLSAHYDHLGVGAPDSTGDRIYNGANDDGSGTIGVLSAARAFAKAR